MPLGLHALCLAKRHSRLPDLPITHKTALTDWAWLHVRVCRVCVCDLRLHFWQTTDEWQQAAESERESRAKTGSWADSQLIRPIADGMAHCQLSPNAWQLRAVRPRNALWVLLLSLLIESVLLLALLMPIMVSILFILLLIILTCTSSTTATTHTANRGTRNSTDTYNTTPSNNNTSPVSTTCIISNTATVISTYNGSNTAFAITSSALFLFLC